MDNQTKYLMIVVMALSLFTIYNVSVNGTGPKFTNPENHTGAAIERWNRDFIIGF